MPEHTIHKKIPQKNQPKNNTIKKRLWNDRNDAPTQINRHPQPNHPSTNHPQKLFLNNPIHRCNPKRG